MTEQGTFGIISGIGGFKEDFEPLASMLLERGIATELFEPPMMVESKSRKANRVAINTRDHAFSDELAERIMEGNLAGLFAHSRAYIAALLAVEKARNFGKIPLSFICPPLPKRGSNATTSVERNLRLNIEQDLGANHASHPGFIDRLMRRWDENGHPESKRDVLMAEVIWLCDETTPTTFAEKLQPIDWPVQVFVSKSDFWYLEPPKKNGLIVNEIEDSSHFPHVTHPAKVAESISSYVTTFRERFGVTQFNRADAEGVLA